MASRFTCIFPRPQVFSTRLDSAKTRVYSRQTGLLVPTDPNLETQVRQEAERQLQEAALADGILRTAQQNATATITSLLQGLGFEKIEFEVTKSDLPDARCSASAAAHVQVG